MPPSFSPPLHLASFAAGSSSALKLAPVQQGRSSARKSKGAAVELALAVDGEGLWRYDVRHEQRKELGGLRETDGSADDTDLLVPPLLPPTRRSRRCTRPGPSPSRLRRPSPPRPSRSPRPPPPPPRQSSSRSPRPRRRAPASSGRSGPSRQARRSSRFPRRARLSTSMPSAAQRRARQRPRRRPRRQLRLPDHGRSSHSPRPRAQTPRASRATMPLSPSRPRWRRRLSPSSHARPLPLLPRPNQPSSTPRSTLRRPFPRPRPTARARSCSRSLRSARSGSGRSASRRRRPQRA